MRLRPLPLLVTAAGLALARAAPARAGGLELSPVLLELSAGARQGAIMLRNGASEPSRYRISVAAWRQGSGGEMKLAPTQDLAFFPELLTLRPSDQRVIRVAATVLPGQVEGTYRIVIEELPPPQAVGAPTGVHTITRITIPVFLEPAKRAAHGAIEGLALEPPKLTFRLRSLGNVRIRPRSVRVRGLGEHADTVFERQLEAWYVLAGGERLYELAIPADSCARVRSVAVEATTERETLGARLEAPRGACGP